MERFYTFIFKRLFLLLIISFSYLSAQNMGPTDDFDGDGIINSIDIDDDNDGVPDAVESPSCYYLASEWNTGVKPTTNGVTISSALVTTTANFGQLLDNVSGTTAVTFTAGQAIQNANVYLFTFAQAVRLDALYLKFNTATQFVGNTKIQGSNTNNGSDWVDLSANVAATAGPYTTVNGNISLTTSIKYPVTLNTTTAYKYIRITGAASATTSATAQNSSEVYFDFNIANYVASSYPKATCTDANIDGDGILPQFDLDSDGDGCSDAYEAGATTNFTTNFKFTGAVGQNGLDNTLETSDNGIVNYNSTYHAYAQSSAIQSCKDTDGDGILDINDIDDDNDGIPDLDEQARGNCNTTNCTSWVTPASTGAGTSAPTTIIVDGEEVSYTITRNTSFTQQGASGYTLQCSGAAVTGIPYWQRVDANNQTMTFNFSKPVTNFQIIMAAIETAPPGLIESIQVTTNNSTGQQTICESCNKSGIVTIDGQNLTVLGNGTGTEIFNVNGPTFTSITIKVTSVGGAFLMSYGLCALKTYSESVYTDIDTDGDDIPNRLDLDSDGDGCPDLKEAKVTPLTDVITASATNNVGGSYGIANPAGAQLNPAAADVNNDGLNDSVDSDVNGSPDYSSTYNPIAISKAINLCSDVDGDTISDVMDIDDDNDGITDVTESPTCFYTMSDLKSTLNITSDLSFTSSTQPFSLALDGNTTTWADIDNGIVIDKNLIEVTMPLANPIPISTVTIQIGINNAFPGSSFQLQGWTGNSWEAMSATQAMTAPNTTYTFTNTLHPTKTYNKFRIRGLAGYATSGTRLHEVNFTFTQPFVSSLQPKATCTNDTDSDTILNHQDLDSDGDTCPDALESGVSVNAGAFTSMSSSGGAIYTGGIASGTPNAYVGTGSPSQYGTNGFFNGIETTLDNGVYNGTYTYSLYALSSTQNACTDTDGDNVPDVFDIDDDNDGVLDIVESPSCAFVDRSDATNLLAWDFEQNLNTLPTAEYNATQTQPFGTRTFGPGIVDVSGSNLYRFTGATATNFADAVANGDYIQYYFTTTSTYLSIDKIYNYNLNYNPTLKQGLIISTDPNFTTYEVLNTGASTTTTGNYNTMDTYSNYPLSLNTKYYVRFVYYGITGGSTVASIDAIGLSFNGISNGGACIDGLDLDNDGIPNSLDLDSDGDGCPDTKEAILYNHATEASIAGDVKNGSGGNVTSTVNTPNAMVPGPYGNNGFADALQSSSNPDAYKYVYSYLFVATDADVSTCDNKFLYDIDSDDDGIPDAVESPSCFYTEAQAMDITEGVTSDFTWATANPLSNTYDNNTAATNFGAVSAPTATSIQNKALITFDLPVIDATFINSVTLNVGGVGFGTGKWKLQGLDVMTNTWTDLSAAAGQAMSANTTYVFTNTLQPTTRYYSYRIIGVDNVNITNAARLIEFTIQYKNYNPSYHRTKTGCNSDADGDGVPNYIDRDSDGDGCPDALEAGISKAFLVPNGFFNTGGQVMGDYVTVGGNYGDNGLGDSVETTPDSGIVNYTSTYTQYATNKTLTFCTDTDGDSVPDLIDLDDDNDGVLDTAECTYPAIPTTSSTANIFASWSNTTTAAGTNGDPTYLTSVGSWTAGAGLTAAISGGVINISNVNGSTLGDAFEANEYLEHPFTTTADNYNWLYYVRSSASNATNYHWAMLISDDNFVTYTILNIDMLRNATGVAVNDINDYQLKPSTSYKVRTYYWGATTLTFDEFTMFGYSECDTDNDSVPNRLDLDSDGDGCTDAVESGTAAQAGAGNTSSGTLVNTSGTQTGVANAIVGNNTPAAYSANGFYNGIENNDTASAAYIGTYTYASAINAAISACFCYKTPAAGTGLETHQGITSLQRAGTDNSGWPMVRKGAWTALESKTKAFVPNRLTITEINNIPVANLKEGMMVYNITSDCIYINTDGTATGWKCFNTQTCP